MEEARNALVPTEETARLWGPDPNHFICSNLMDLFANELVTEQQVRETVNDENSARNEDNLRNLVNDVLRNFRERGVVNIIYSADAVRILADFTANNTAINIFNYCFMFMTQQHE